MVDYCKLASYSNKSLTISHTGTCIYSDTLLEATNHGGEMYTEIEFAKQDHSHLNMTLSAIR